MYQTVSDEYINKLFEGSDFGEAVNNSVIEKRKYLLNSLQRSIDGYGSGSTMNRMMHFGGFLVDDKYGKGKKLTLFGEAFLQTAL